MMGRAFDRLQGVSIDHYTGASGLLQTPTRSEYLGAHVAQGFERTTTGRILEETDIMDAERREGTADEEYRQNVQMLLAQGMTPEAAGMTHASAMSKESWEASPWFRKGMEYRPDMTETRARIMAENYDERRYREQVVAAGDASYGLLTRSLGFGAMLIGSLPDPVNFVSFAGGAAKAQAVLRAAAGAGAAAKAGAMAGMKAGVVEGALGNALADAIVLPDLAARGEDVGFTDLMLDTVFGAIIGAGMGSAGGALAGYVGAKRLARLENLTRLMDGTKRPGVAGPHPAAGEFGTPDNDFLARVGGGEDAARMEEDFHLPRNDDADMARASMTGRDKRDAARAVEKAVSDYSAGQPVDVGPVLRESQALGRAYDTVRDNPLGGPADEVLASLSSPEFERILVERGPAVEGPEGEIIVKDDAFVKTHGSRGWGLVKILWRHGEKSEAAPRFQVTREDIVGMPQRIRDFAPVQGATKRVSKRETRWTIDNGDGTRTVYTIAKRKKGAEAPTLITVFRTGMDIYGASEKRKAPYVLGGREPSHTTGRVARGKSPNYQDTAGGGFAHSSPEAKGRQTIRRVPPKVNPEEISQKKEKPSASLAGENPQPQSGRTAGGKSPNYQDTAGGGLKSLVPEAEGKNRIDTGHADVNTIPDGKARSESSTPDARSSWDYSDKTPLSWGLMLEKNLSQNALMDMQMTRCMGETWFLSPDEKRLPRLATNGNLDFDDFRVGLARWRKKYPESPGLKEIEEHLDWIDAKNAALGLDPLSRSGEPERVASTGRPNVNFAVEQRENYAPAPDVEAHDAQGARDAADAATLQQLEEMTASGRMDEESARALAESRDMAARAEQYDELGQSVIECIWKAEA